jgi:uncharacterized protein
MTEDEPYTGPPPMVRPVWPPPPGPWQRPAWQPPPWQQPPPQQPSWVPPPRGWQQPPLWQPPPPPHPMGPPPGVRWAPPPGTPPHDVPQPFLLAMRSRDWAWWRPALGLLLFSVVYLVLSIVAVIAGVLVAADGFSALPEGAEGDLLEPGLLLLINVSLIVAIPVVWMAWAVAHGMRTGWSSSVLVRLRLRLVPRYVALALATVGLGLVLSFVIGFTVDGETPTGPVRSFGWLVVVVILTTPLQSAAEEYFFRGYFSQAIAGWVGAPRAGAVVAAVVTATLFSLAHLPADWPTFLDRFAFGLAASAVVWLTGGLEAAIVLHAVNNVLVFLGAGALGGGVATEEVPEGTGPLYLLVSVLAMAAYVWLVARSSRRLRPEMRTAAQDLRFPGQRVQAAVA